MLADLTPAFVGFVLAASVIGNIILTLRLNARQLGVVISVERKDQDMSPEVANLIPQIKAVVQAKDDAVAAASQAETERDTAKAQLSSLQDQLNTANNQIATLQADHTDDVTQITNALAEPAPAVNG